MAKMNARANATIDMGKGLKVTCEARKMKIVLDEPEQLGGTDLGMNPVEALLSGLAGCKCIVAKSVVMQKGLKVDAIEINCKGSLDTDGFMGINPDVKVGLTEVETVYDIKTSESKDAINELISYVETHCPVFDTIKNAPSFSHTINIK